MKIHRVKISEADIKQLASKIPPKPSESAVVDFSQCIVKKPWGHEYLMYRNNFVEVWSLFIKEGQSTSMHCHPNKKTGMLLIEGEAVFSNLNVNIFMKPLDALVVDAGAFKKTKAVSPGGIKLLEFETPPAKHDLLRLSDEYGRENQAYEGANQMMADTGTSIRFPDSEEVYSLEKTWGDCSFRIKKIGTEKLLAEDLKYFSDHNLVVILEGLIYWPGNDQIYGVAEVLRAEDILDNRDALRIFNLTLMGVKKQSSASVASQSLRSKIFHQ